jgi:hypothetical protein
MPSKKIITNKKNVKLIKKLMTDEAFNEKFKVSMKIVQEIIADEIIVNSYFEDSRMATTDEIQNLMTQGIM